MKYTLFVCILFFTSACVNSEIPVEEGDFIVHFCHKTPCLNIFSEYIASANDLQCALYDLDPSLLEIMPEHAELIIDEDANLNVGLVKKGKGLMHNKFCVINETYVITGSFNPVKESDDDYNNLVIIESPALAKRYQNIFSSLLSQSDLEEFAFIHNGVLIESFACPQNDCQQAIIDELSTAQDSISFALFTFTDKQIAELLIEKNNFGVPVSGIVESWQSKTYAQHPYLLDAGIPVTLETSSRLQHNKIFVIDNKTVITGSYNPTRAAHTINDENLLIIRDRQVAAFYSKMIHDITQNFKYGALLTLKG